VRKNIRPVRPHNIPPRPRHGTETLAGQPEGQTGLSFRNANSNSRRRKTNQRCARMAEKSGMAEASRHLKSAKVARSEIMYPRRALTWKKLRSILTAPSCRRAARRRTPVVAGGSNRVRSHEAGHGQCRNACSSSIFPRSQKDRYFGDTHRHGRARVSERGGAQII